MPNGPPRGRSGTLSVLLALVLLEAAVEGER